MGLVGVDESLRALDAALRGLPAEGAALVLLRGPPGSGKTSAAEDALARFGYSVYRAGAESVPLEIRKIKKFCATTSTVADLLSGAARRPRAVLVDDALDGRSVCSLFDALRSAGARVLVVASVGRSAKAPDVQRRASAVVRFGYVDAALLERLLAGDNPGEDPVRVRRCASASGGCVPRARQLLAAERYGTVAEPSARGVDTTIFDDVERALRMREEGRPYADVERAISNEPSMAALVLRSSLPAPGPATRAAFRDMSRVPGGDWFSAACSTAVFVRTARAEGCGGGHEARAFPRCYTTLSSRATNARRRAEAARASAQARG